MLKKIIGIGLLVGVIGVLAFGAINRTLAKSETSEVEYGGGGNGRIAREVQEAESIESVDTWHEAEDHDHELENLPLGTLDQAETDALQFMLEEEKLARDVYTALYEMWGSPIFANIASSEQNHMDAVLGLLTRYEITPVMSAQAGVFTNPDLQSLYDQLIAQGSQSLNDALLVGGTIEEVDILDLEKRLLQTDQEDITTVFESLRSGSINHLAAFSGNYERQSGLVYQPQVLSAEAYQTLLSETSGNGAGQGGRGRGGHGNGN